MRIQKFHPGYHFFDMIEENDNLGSKISQPWMTRYSLNLKIFDQKWPFCMKNDFITAASKSNLTDIGDRYIDIGDIEICLRQVWDIGDKSRHQHQISVANIKL